MNQHESRRVAMQAVYLSNQELKYSKEIEPKAAVNEALNLCDEFADPKDKPFINGMLANFI